MYKSNGGASRSYTTSTYHIRGPLKTNPKAVARRDKRTGEKVGRPRTLPLDPEKPCKEALLIVSRPLSLAMVAHQYVASVMIECGGNRTQARLTLGLSIGGLNRFLKRIETGEIGKNQVHIRNSNRKDARRGKTRKAVQPVPVTEQDEGVPEVRNAG